MFYTYLLVACHCALYLTGVQSAIQMKTALPPGITTPAGPIDRINWDAEKGYQNAVKFYGQPVLLRCTVREDYFYNEQQAYTLLNKHRNTALALPVTSDQYFGRIRHVIEWNDEYGCLMISHDSNAIPVKQFIDTVKPEDKSKHLSIITSQLIEGLIFIQSKGLVHGSINLDSIFIVPGNKATPLHVLFTNFAQSLSETTSDGTNIEFTIYSPPETYINGLNYDLRLHDSWALGTVLFILVTNRFPYGYQYVNDKPVKMNDIDLFNTMNA
ncbi:hypothetical protein BDF22DRAFT_731714 [Syncephalis plumigaleata]|nr:hypothetical protein BDF22DRAFT_731714 [Syncephalis plumigaleata]